MKPIVKLLSLITLFTCIFSCDLNLSDSKRTVPESIGSENNIIVVTDSSIWTSGVKDLLSDNFEKNYPVLNQPEPYYKLLDIKFVELNSLLKRSKIIFFIADLSKKSRLSEFIMQAIGEKGLKKMSENNGYYSLSIKEYWSKPQLIVFCAAKSNKALLTGLENEQLSLFNKVNQFESQLMKNRYNNIKSTEKYKALIKKRFDMGLNIPKSFSITMETDSFICFTKEIESGYMGIALYTTTYQDTSQFNTKNIISIRDYFLGKHIQGEFDNTPMVTEQRVTPIDKTFYLDSSYSKLTRGLWRLRNEYMGGPFINQTIYNKRTGKLVHIDGFVYAPGKAKKKYLKEIETILSGIKI